MIECVDKEKTHFHIFVRFLHRSGKSDRSVKLDCKIAAIILHALWKIEHFFIVAQEFHELDS